jgi:CheY-like chemotaxis protein
VTGPERKRRPPQAEKPGRLPPGIREKVEHILLAHYAPPCLLVNADDDIVLTLGPVLAYLGTADRGSVTGLWDALPRDLLLPLRTLFERARSDSSHSARGSVFTGEPGRRRSIDVVVRALSGGGAGDLLLLIFEDPEWRVGVEPETDLDVTSRESAGAVAPKEAGTGPAVPVVVPGPEATRARRVLVIEDHMDRAEGMRLLLELRGYQVTVAHDAAMGIDKARQFQPEVVLCRVGIPGSMDGYGLARFFRADPELQGTCLVAITGAGREEAELAKKAGFDAHLPKPVDPAGLIQLLETLPRRT